MYGNGASAGMAQGTSASYMYFLFSSVIATVYGASVVDVLDYASTTKYKTLRSLSGSDENGSGNLTIHSGLWQSTSAINAIKIFPETGNFRQYTQFALYGIRG
jgi:Na+/H+-translocating membrane pyrophosphatase